MQTTEQLIKEAVEAWKDYYPYQNPGPKAIARLHIAMANLEKIID